MSKLLFIGTGKMATAIAGGIVRKKVIAPLEMAGFDVSQTAAENFTKATGIRAVTADLKQVVADAENVLIAVKPQYLESALSPLKGCFEWKLVLSIVAGIPISRLAELTDTKRIIRIMPNTPALVGQGAAAYAGGSGVTPDDLKFAGTIFNAVGIGLPLPEPLLDAVTGLSGSGPAYVFEFIQALADGGVAEGLPRDVALRLAAQTVLGSAAMVLATGVHPEILKDQVTSPAGTSSRGVEVLAERGFTGTVMKAVRAAAQRSAELGKNK